MVFLGFEESGREDPERFVIETPFILPINSMQFYYVFLVVMNCLAMSE